MRDHLVKALAFDGQVRAYAAVTTNLVSEAQQRHDTWATASAALGRTLTGAQLFATMFKGDNKLTVKIEGDGPMGAIVADADAQGDVRGYVRQPHVDFDLNAYGKLDVARAVGDNGTFSVVKDLGMRDHFTGEVPLASGEIGDDFAYYFAASEQVPSTVGLGVLVNPDHSIRAAGGMIVQMLPGAAETTIAHIEKNISKAASITSLVDAGHTPESMLEAWLDTPDIKMTETMDLAFTCSCSRERFANGIASLGAEEIDAMIAEDGFAEATCHFCGAAYHFNQEELTALKSS